MTTSDASARPARTRRLSPWRVALAVVLTTAVVSGAVVFAQSWWSQATTTVAKPWFAGYVDVTATPSYAFEVPVSKAARDVVLSFVVSDADDACTPSWGSVYTLDEAATSLDLDRRVARLAQEGGEAIVSFGGQANDELATNCTDPNALEQAYASVVDRYDSSTIDVDLEGEALTAASATRRAEALATLQEARRAAGKPLAIWLTLPVTPDGLTTDGTDAVAAFLAAGVDLTGVNAMTMDYGDSRGTDTMLDASTAALTATHRQLGILYKTAGVSLTDRTLWAKIGATPMIGQNDVAGEVFSLAAAKALNTWADTNGLARMSMWAMNRDATCGPNYADVTRVSDACSGVEQGSDSFATVLGKGLTGSPNAGGAVKTTSEPVAAEVEDDPATSPYPIWSESSTYLAKTKVVWHRNVYEAKWWTKGDLPDSPALDAYEVAWTLIGPVLPGETPAPVITLPTDSYDEWTGKTVYEKGDRVIYAGLGFEAKWWTQGDSPEAVSTNPDASPWTPLTDDQIAAVIADQAGTE